jgi:hypothetical protein
MADHFLKFSDRITCLPVVSMAAEIFRWKFGG